MQVIDCEQGTDEWFQARLGVPTASQFATVMAKGRGGTESKTRATYMRKLAGELLTGAPMENFTNGAMERGHAVEDQARNNYAFINDVDVQTVGFILNDNRGCSPDGLVGDVGMLEIKSKAPHLLIEVLERDDVPPEHIAQIQGQLWVAEREWVDFIAFYPGMPIFQKRVERDEEYIANMSAEVDQFNEELAALVERIKSMQEAA